VIEAEVGDRNVLKKMQENDAKLGGEPSGNLIFLEESSCSDAVITALKVLELLQKKGFLWEEIQNNLTLMPQSQKNIEVSIKPSLSLLPCLSQALKHTEQKLGNDGKVLFRYSGTEQKARILIESPSKDFNEASAEVIEKAFLKDIEEIQKKEDLL
jgi:phosphoglucosamine mutase